MLGPALALRTILTKPTQITDRLQKNVLNRHAWAHPRPDPDRDRDLDRTHLPPPPPRQAGPIDPIEYETIMTTTADEAA